MERDFEKATRIARGLKRTLDDVVEAKEKAVAGVGVDEGRGARARGEDTRVGNGNGALRIDGERRASGTKFGERRSRETDTAADDRTEHLGGELGIATGKRAAKKRDAKSGESRTGVGRCRGGV